MLIPTEAHKMPVPTLKSTMNLVLNSFHHISSLLSDWPLLDTEYILRLILESPILCCSVRVLCTGSIWHEKQLFTSFSPPAWGFKEKLQLVLLARNLTMLQFNKSIRQECRNTFIRQCKLRKIELEPYNYILRDNCTEEKSWLNAGW